MPVTPVTTAMAINPAIMQYSIAVAPSVALRNRRISNMVWVSGSARDYPPHVNNFDYCWRNKTYVDLITES